MMIRKTVEICVGSSCHIKGSADVVAYFRQALEAHGLTEQVALAGSFCMGSCNREGVSVRIDGVLFPGVTLQSAPAVFDQQILLPLKGKGA